MLVSLNFVERFISLPKIENEITINNKTFIQKIIDIQKITPILTRQGFEVDSVKILGENFNNVIVGKIESAQPHPNASKLQICQVNIGEKNLKQIVCGASNARGGLYVAVALPGAKLPNGIEIKPTFIRDIESNGMLCSREELGLPINKEIDGDGIWELDNQAQGGTTKQELERNLGIPVFEALSLNDIILEISVTPNRPDMLCHEGVARELAAGFDYAKISYEKKKPYFAQQDHIHVDKIKADALESSHLKIEKFIFTAENFLNAPTFFMGIGSVKVTSSPAWLRNLLEALGQNSINNIVDASNYILLAYGQPNHAFDFDKINTENENNKKITIRHAISNENFIGLDGKKRQLHEADCVVSDSKEVHALLGVLGGESSKVTEKTEKIIVEFANPNPVSIRRTSRRHGRQTDASFIFEKGIDESARFKASSEFFALLCKISGEDFQYLGTFHSKNLQNAPVIKTEFTNRIITFTNKDQKRILGSDIINFKAQKDILISLGFIVEERSEDIALVTIPQWRNNDIANEADLVEECVRVVGIDTIPPQPIISANEVKQDDVHLSFIEKLSAHSANLGYHEVISLHFMRADDYQKLNLPSINNLGEPVALINPIIGDEPFMHITLIPDLLRKVAKNLSYGVKAGQLFHSCRTFQNYNAHGKRVFLENGTALKLQGPLSSPITHNLYEYSSKYGYAYSHEPEQTSRIVETPRLAGLVFGAKQEKNWQNSGPISWSLHDLIAHVIELGRVLGVHLETMKISKENEFHPISQALHPGRRVAFSVQLKDDIKLPIGWCGEFHPKVLRNFEIDTICLGFEINIANIILAVKNLNPSVKSSFITPKFPAVYRDFAFLLDEQVTADYIKETVEKSLVSLNKIEIPVNLSDIYIFDIYRGKGVPAGKKSVAFKISIEPIERTLTDKDIQVITEKIVHSMENEFDSQLRG